MAIAGMALQKYGGIGWHFAFRQWGIVRKQANGSSIFFPIEFLQKAYIVDITDISDRNDDIIGCFSAGDITNTKFTIKCAPVNTGSISSLWALWFCIGQ